MRGPTESSSHDPADAGTITHSAVAITETPITPPAPASGRQCWRPFVEDHRHPQGDDFFPPRPTVLTYGDRADTADTADERIQLPHAPNDGDGDDKKESPTSVFTVPLDESSLSGSSSESPKTKTGALRPTISTNEAGAVEVCLDGTLMALEARNCGRAGLDAAKTFKRVSAISRGRREDGADPGADADSSSPPLLRVLRPSSSLLDADLSSPEDYVAGTGTAFFCSRGVPPDGHNRLEDLYYGLQSQPQPQTPQRDASTSCCNDAASSCWRDSPGGACENLGCISPSSLLRGKICLSLGSTSGVDDFYSGWQTWSYFQTNYSRSREAGAAAATTGSSSHSGDENRDPNRTVGDCYDSANEEEKIRRVLRNRAFHGAHRDERLESLRGDLCPFRDSSRRTVPYRANQPFTKTHSFTTTPRGSTFHLEEKRDGMAKPNRSAGSHLRSVWEWSTMACTNSAKLRRDGSPETKPLIPRKGAAAYCTALHCERQQHEDDDLYDSDPEDFVRKRSSLRRTGTFWNDPQAHFRTGSDDTAHLGNLVLFAEETVQDMVQDFMNQKMTLVHWHCNPPWSLQVSDSDKAVARPLTPRAIHAWVERGSNLDRQGVIVTPKLVWRPIHDECGGRQHGRDGASRCLRRRRRPTPLGSRELLVPDLSGVDLLDIHRIVELEQVEVPPTRASIVAKRHHCFIVKTHNRSVVLEARSKEERDRLVRSLKLVVARLGSTVVMGDNETLVKEFFVPSCMEERSWTEEAGNNQDDYFYC